MGVFNFINKKKEFQEAVESNDLEKVTLLLKNKKYSPSYDNNLPIVYAAYKGYTEIFKLLLNDPRVNPNDVNEDYESPLKLSSSKAYTDIVKLLLNDSRINPSNYNNEAIRIASKEGQVEVVALLLQDSRIDPTSLCNWSIERAFLDKHFEVVKLLFNEERVFNTLKINNENLHNDILKMNIQDKVNNF